VPGGALQNRGHRDPATVARLFAAAIGKGLHTPGSWWRAAGGTRYASAVGMRLTNYLDAEGHPICPSCGKGIGPVESAARIDDCLVHMVCFRAARERQDVGLDPCEPAT
jgi:hypothetical protein